MSCNNLSEEMLLGEKRWLEFKVVSCGSAPQYFNIINATYEFKKLYDEGDVATGDCVVDNEAKTIKCFVAAVEKGSFIMVLTWLIGEEIFKEKVRINVC